MRNFEVTFSKKNYFTVPVIAETLDDAERIALDKLDQSYLMYHRPYEEDLEVVLIDEVTDYNAM